MLLKSNKVEIGYKIDNFSLLNIDNTYLEMQKIITDNGLVIAFICNHCPYVKDIIVRLVEDFQYLQSLNVGTVAVMPNDADKYPEDSFENMKKFSTYYNFKFPYLYDKERFESSKLSNLEFKGFVNPEDVNRYISKSRFLVNTSEHEGFPNTLEI